VQFNKLKVGELLRDVRWVQNKSKRMGGTPGCTHAAERARGPTAGAAPDRAACLTRGLARRPSYDAFARPPLSGSYLEIARWPNHPQRSLRLCRRLRVSVAFATPIRCGRTGTHSGEKHTSSLTQSEFADSREGRVGIDQRGGRAGGQIWTSITQAAVRRHSTQFHLESVNEAHMCKK
jgi:hypothetical protein